MKKQKVFINNLLCIIGLFSVIDVGIVFVNWSRKRAFEICGKMLLKIKSKKEKKKGVENEKDKKI